MTDIYEALGRNVRVARKRLRINQAELAKRVKMSRTSVCNIEAGRQGMSIAALYRFGAAFGIEPRDLISNIPMPPKIGVSLDELNDVECDFVQRVIAAASTPRE